MLADFGRTKERSLWFPILKRHGFTRLDLSDERIDHENAIDAIAYDSEGNQRLFALRSRVPGNYSAARLAEYKRQFTIRYSRPSGVPVEWQKLFELEMPVVPDYFAYGWCNANNSAIQDYVILNIPTLQTLYREGYLNDYLGNIRTNIDARRSKFVYLPIYDLIQVAENRQLITYHSEGHPGLSQNRTARPTL